MMFGFAILKIDDGWIIVTTLYYSSHPPRELRYYRVRR